MREKPFNKKKQLDPCFILHFYKLAERFSQPCLHALNRLKESAKGQGNKVNILSRCRWLATDEDDGAIVRELTEEGTPQLLNSESHHRHVL